MHLCQHAPVLAHAAHSAGSTAPAALAGLGSLSRRSTHTLDSIVTLERLGEDFNQTVLPLRYTPRKMVVNPLNNHLIVIETDHNAYNQHELKELQASLDTAGGGALGAWGPVWVRTADCAAAVRGDQRRRALTGEAPQDRDRRRWHGGSLGRSRRTRNQCADAQLQDMDEKGEDDDERKQREAEAEQQAAFLGPLKAGAAAALEPFAGRRS